MFGNQKASTSVAKANLFNRFFAFVFQKPIFIQQQARMRLQIFNELHLIQTSIEEMKNALKAISEITLSLTCLINLSLRVGRVPKDWKCANIVPVF